MDIRNDTLKPLSDTSYESQVARQYKGSAWRPQGYERFPYMNKLQDAMPVLQGATQLSNPDRFAPVGPLEEN